MDSSSAGWTGQARAPLAFRPSLHSIEQIVHALVPYYGLSHPVAAFSTDPLHGETCIQGTLDSIASMLNSHAALSRPVLVIR